MSSTYIIIFLLTIILSSKAFSQEEANLLDIAQRYAAWSIGNSELKPSNNFKSEPRSISLEEYNQLRWSNNNKVNPNTIILNKQEPNVIPIRKFQHFVRIEPQNIQLPIIQPLYPVVKGNQTFIQPASTFIQKPLDTAPHRAHAPIPLLDPYPRITLKTPPMTSPVTSSPQTAGSFQRHLALPENIVNGGTSSTTSNSRTTSAVIPSERQRTSISRNRQIISDDMIEEKQKKTELNDLVRKKQRFGMRGMSMYSEYEDPFPHCQMGWCGHQCCQNSAVHATTLPGSPTPNQPFVVVIHPNPTAQCAPSCQPQCLPQCTSHVQFAPFPMQEIQSHRPFCRPDCMPSCHVDCLIVPPATIRCNVLPCHCSGAYTQCSPFTCCIRYPNMLKRHRTELEKGNSTETQEYSSIDTPLNAVGAMNSPERRNFRKNRGKAALRRKLAILTAESKRGEYRTTTSSPRNAVIVTMPPRIRTTTSTPTTTRPTTTSTTTTTTTTTPLSSTRSYRVTPMPRVITRRTTTTTTEMPRTTEDNFINLSSSEVTLRPIYPLKLTVTTSSPISFIPDYKMWSFKRKQIREPQNTSIRSDNFLEILSELAQVNQKEDLVDYQNAHNFLKYLTDTG